jgi:4,5:9,10-diseco-3-hydroxy-5,9,17-trioxoandrosta-1(10),2-diene-4-oate hydrolase
MLKRLPSLALAALAGAGLAYVVTREVTRRAAAHAAQSRAVRDRYVGGFPVQRRSCQVLGCTTHLYETRPQATSQPPLVLIHGGVIEAASWMETVAALGTGRRILVPDLPAHGASAYLSPSRLVAWLEAFIESEVGSSLVDVCGHSMGGGLALYYAARHSRRIRRLILCAPVGVGQSLPHIWPVPSTNRRLSLWPLHNSLIERVWGNSSEITDEQRFQFGIVVRDFFYSLRWWWYLSGGMQWLVNIPETVLRAIQCPALFIWGDQDRIVRFNGHATLRRIQQLPNARLHLLEGLGHLPQVESPPAFNAVVHEFLSA